MGYFLAFISGMGFAALIDFTVQLVRLQMNVTSERIADRVVEEVFAVNPVKVDPGQPERLRNTIGL